MKAHDNNRNFVIAIFLSIAVILVWRYTYQNQHVKDVAQQEQQKLAFDQTREKAAAILAANTSAQTNASAESTARLTLKSGELEGSIALQGARFDDMILTSYRETIEKDSPSIRLLSSGQKDSKYFAEFGWLGDAASQAQLPNKHTVWQTEQSILTPESPALLTWTNSQGVVFERKISIDAANMLTIEDTVINKGTMPLHVAPFGLLNRNIIEDGKHNAILHEGPMGTANGKLEEHTYGDLKKNGTQTQPQASGWLGITDKYWLTAIIPDQKQYTSKYNYYAYGKEDKYQADYLGAMQNVDTGKSLTVTTRFFVGAKKLATLEHYAQQYNIPLFDRAVDFGNLYFLTIPMFKLLHYYYELLGNFGLAILLLTVTVKLFLFPLANKSYVSLAHMRELQPDLARLKERYAEDRIKLNQETIALYKREKVNPAAGCLPLFIQMPVFFALYKVLYVTIEMRHAPFLGWLQDLTSPDASNLFTLFGLVPWDAPSFLHLGILPIIMTITMIIQQSLNPKPTDPTQAQVIKYMPYIFLFLFKGFASGLVLYWVWNNTLSIIQQWVITKRHEAKSALKHKHR
jgi:YidC/Oxa1 family membrane protein insertase